MAAVQVWRVDLDQPDAVVSALEQHLDADEVAAAEARVGAVRSRFVVARGSLRELLAAATGAAPKDVVIDRTCLHCGHPRHGRPRLAGGTDIEFSLSHSDGLALVAVTPRVRVGIDVEVVKPRGSLPRLAQRIPSSTTRRTQNGGRGRKPNSWRRSSMRGQRARPTSRASGSGSCGG
jgi:4'-phosphopantetheinyl transferase